MRSLAGLLALAGSGVVLAAPDGQASLPTVTVIGITPIPGAVIDADKIPANVESVVSADLRREGSTNLAGALNANLASIHLNDTLSDPFQADVLYRGFEASPVVGTPQGLAVYQNGVRINEAFGDAVNWDLVPDVAVRRLDFVSANPVYGLNALGGAASLAMKDGFSYHGAELELAAGSFKRRAGTAQFGYNNGRQGIYIAASVANADGWRFFAHDRIRQFYSVLSRHAGDLTLDLSFAHAHNRLSGAGATPLQSLAVDVRNVFTGPQANVNRLDFVTLNAAYALDGGRSVQSVLYYRSYRQAVTNGDVANYLGCTSATFPGQLCQGDGVTPLADGSGRLIPDISRGGALPVGQNDFENIRSRTVGASLQLHHAGRMGRFDNQLTVGASADLSHTDFMSGTQLGVIDAALVVQPSAYFVDTPEGTDFAATPVLLQATHRYFGFFLSDTIDVSAALSVTASGRYNIAQVDLYDQRGTNLNGRNRYTHFNPAIGATYKLTGHVTAYGGYSMTNRAPSASEIECSDPNLPCVLPSSLAGDPPNLKQVIAHTYEAGLRGTFAGRDVPAQALSWNVGVFRTQLNDDIFAVASSVSRGYYQNIRATRREGADAGVKYRWSHGDAFVSYSYIEATFRTAFLLPSRSSPAHDVNGDIQVLARRQLPLIPRNRLKAGVDIDLLPQWRLGGTLVLVSAQYYRGDESNSNPQLPGYATVSLRTTYRIGRRAEVFISVHNLFDRRYATYGLYSDPTGVGAPGVPPDALSNDPRVDNRFQSPGEPRSLFGGVRIAF